MGIFTRNGLTKKFLDLSLCMLLNNFLNRVFISLKIASIDNKQRNLVQQKYISNKPVTWVYVNNSLNSGNTVQGNNVLCRRNSKTRWPNQLCSYLFTIKNENKNSVTLLILNLGVKSEQYYQLFLTHFLTSGFLTFP